MQKTENIPTSPLIWFISKPISVLLNFHMFDRFLDNPTTAYYHDIKWPRHVASCDLVFMPLCKIWSWYGVSLPLCAIGYQVVIHTTTMHILSMISRNPKTMHYVLLILSALATLNDVIMISSDHAALRYIEIPYLYAWQEHDIERQYQFLISISSNHVTLPNIIKILSIGITYAWYDQYIVWTCCF